METPKIPSSGGSLRNQLKNAGMLNESQGEAMVVTEDYCHGIILHTLKSGVFVFPYSHLIFGHLATGDDPGLMLQTATHTALIRGLKLSDLLEPLADQKIKILRAVPERYRETAGSAIAGVTVREITVVEREVPAASTT